MVEAFTSEHKEDINTVLIDWPSKKFEALYLAYSKRKVADELNSSRQAQIAALWANSNLDGQDNKDLRNDWQEKIDDQFSKAIMRLYDELIEEEEEIDYDDPFFAPIKKGKEARDLPEPETIASVGGDN